MGVIPRRNRALTFFIKLTTCVLLYVCAHYGLSGSWQKDAPDNRESGRGAAVLIHLFQDNISGSKTSQINNSIHSTSDAKAIIFAGADKEDKKRPDTSTTGGDRAKRIEANKIAVKEEHTIKKPEGSSLTQRSVTPSRHDVTFNRLGCNEKSTEPRIAQRGNYWVLYNYVPMLLSVECWETITYTTHADFTFLDNLEPLLERWKAPVSIAMYAPGNDFQPTLESIKYSRNCGSPLVAQLVTFHLYFSREHVPEVVPQSDKALSAEPYNCSLGPPWTNMHYTTKMYKNEKKLSYPINVGRNVAKESAVTHYILSSDIELYPSPALSSTFLEMIKKNDQPPLFEPNPKVFVLPVFEVDEKSVPPLNKTTLIQMLKAGSAIPFHKKLCSACHNVPKSKEWQESPETNGLHIFHVGKRTGKFVHWEPFFIGTNSDPIYDERLIWDGKRDKMTQAYALCVLDYDFLILDNAFLVHRPGIKIFRKDPRRERSTAKTNVLMKKIIIPELKVMYGVREGCAL